jgi:hypothetical protein
MRICDRVLGRGIALSPGGMICARASTEACLDGEALLHRIALAHIPALHISVRQIDLSFRTRLLSVRNYSAYLVRL